MKTRKIIFWLFFFFTAVTFSITSCKKDTTSSTSFTSQQTAQVQNSDAQDAIADKTEEDVDNKLEELQNNDYAAANMKSFAVGLTDTVVIAVDHPDTTTFPKVVTLTYYNYTDSSSNEPITKNGTITVTVNRSNSNNLKLISREFDFADFAVTTDSTTIIINGTRTVNRTKAALQLTGLQLARISVTDNITATLSYAVATTGKTDTLKFTRDVNRTRTAISHFKNVKFKANAPAYNLTHLDFKHIASSDTITYDGSVTGVNEKGNTYTKTIASTLEITVYKGSLIISTGTMSYATSAGDSYSILFEQDPSHPHLTLVTVTNNQTGKTKSFDRRFGRIFNKWW